MSPFAALESRINASVLQHLANARVLIGGVEVPGIFKNPSSVAALGNGVADSRPSVMIASNTVPANPVDQLIQIDGIPYGILNDDPDGTGLTLLILERTQ